MEKNIFSQSRMVSVEITLMFLNKLFSWTLLLKNVGSVRYSLKKLTLLFSKDALNWWKMT